MKSEDYSNLWGRLNRPRSTNENVRVIVRRKFQKTRVAEERAFYLPDLGKLFTFDGPAHRRENLFTMFYIKSENLLPVYKARAPVPNTWYTDRVVFKQCRGEFAQWAIPGLWDVIDAMETKVVSIHHQAYYVRFASVSSSKIDSLCDQCERREMIFGEALKWAPVKDGGCYDTDLPSSP